LAVKKGGSHTFKRKTAAKMLIVKTDAQCTDLRIGKLLVDYVDKTLTPTEETKFEQHVRDCLACGAMLINAMELRHAASQSHR
jgi:Putative zinc-finger